jgi:hypothetical protein
VKRGPGRFVALVACVIVLSAVSGVLAVGGAVEPVAWGCVFTVVCAAAGCGIAAVVRGTMPWRETWVARFWPAAVVIVVAGLLGTVPIMMAAAGETETLPTPGGSETVAVGLGEAAFGRYGSAFIWLVGFAVAALVGAALVAVVRRRSR